MRGLSLILRGGVSVMHCSDEFPKITTLLRMRRPMRFVICSVSGERLPLAPPLLSNGGGGDATPGGGGVDFPPLPTPFPPFAAGGATPFLPPFAGAGGAGTPFPFDFPFPPEVASELAPQLVLDDVFLAGVGTKFLAGPDFGTSV